MKKFTKLAMASVLVGMGGMVSAQNLETVTEQTSYYFGLDLGSNLAQQVGQDRIDVESVILGLRDGLSQLEPRLTMDEIRTAVMALQQELQQEQEGRVSEMRQAGDTFLAENATKEGVMVTPSGLQYEVITAGAGGASPEATDTVRVHYHGTLIDGTVFDSSVTRGEPVEFPLNGVIPGWTEGVQLMSEGDKYRFYIPSDLGYRDQAVGSIPPFSVLVFEVELLEVL
ncbi:FKBP-type peptidyl-prolyl cis-trans isomerase [Salinispirillum marinum]|uniref:Peptidyl-prolyl cis-trans isomerase n=2 Tax=Saccharospirillaceae TaxID=255527 RepID=A0ABV8BCR2_9GAMM